MRQEKDISIGEVLTFLGMILAFVLAYAYSGSIILAIIAAFVSGGAVGSILITKP